ncbi:hypothetical protein GobsT_63960 [Gemmata obscuriglobus]|uniref:Uncharacterized protein n=1 Tax=Gemmata obscuriglobus TaxID=114 RepID=A0A2Z3GWW1_9BACT|nr:Imm1 family immunity protein [Gemmata obscuriglobus]AWM35876.1 hypothetical protein C1280_01820 [Gemmata obscuriglobus]QEG31574.1 hypothetical protein GobsT_63960 [Gemmata obscuriglobus]VTS10916.1 unnamed protein product [Gemmata obscuriglobus UQM 2246]
MPEVYFDHAEVDGPIPPGADAIVRLMRERGEDYWNDAEDGPGFKSLYYYAEGRDSDVGCTAELVLTKKDRYGFHFWLHYPVSWVDSPYYREHESHYSCSDPDLREWVGVGDSHEGQRPIFAGLFVPVEDAVEVVREFVRSGERSPRIRWVDGRFIRDAERRHGIP